MRMEDVRVLIADDEPTVRAVVRMTVQSLGVKQVLEAENGRQAVDLFQQEQPDIVLLDINMPHLNGNEALFEIRQIAPEAHVIMLTSVAKLSVAEECVRLGAIDYILKSNPSEKIRELLQRTVEAL